MPPQVSSTSSGCAAIARTSTGMRVFLFSGFLSSSPALFRLGEPRSTIAAARGSGSGHPPEASSTSSFRKRASPRAACRSRSAGTESRDGSKARERLLAPVRRRRRPSAPRPCGRARRAARTGRRFSSPRSRALRTAWGPGSRAPGRARRARATSPRTGARRRPPAAPARRAAAAAAAAALLRRSAAVRRGGVLPGPRATMCVRGMSTGGVTPKRRNIGRLWAWYAISAAPSTLAAMGMRYDFRTGRVMTSAEGSASPERHALDRIGQVRRSPAALAHRSGRTKTPPAAAPAPACRRARAGPRSRGAWPRARRPFRRPSRKNSTVAGRTPASRGSRTRRGSGSTRSRSVSMKASP